MFSVKQKREISDKIQQILRETNHPELPAQEIQFVLHVRGAEFWSWADICNNGAVPNPGVNAWNELQDTTHQEKIEKFGERYGIGEEGVKKLANSSPISEPEVSP